MSYDNTEPKTLKTLNSSGQVLNDSGNVISDTSDYWVKVYNEAEPKVDKILHSDGTIKDSAGNLIQDTTAFNVKKYIQAEPIPAKYLHSDGTIDENPSGGSGADLEDNHQTTINVSTYTEPIEITPIVGKDGMKKATITLSNIPSGGATKLYAWGVQAEGYITNPIMYSTSDTPEIGDSLITSKGESGEPTYITLGDYTVEGYSAGKITVTYDDESIELVRDSSGDIDLN